VCVWCVLEPRCVSEMNATEQTFTTPNYPHNYLSNYECQWVIRAVPGHRHHNIALVAARPMQ